MQTIYSLAVLTPDSNHDRLLAVITNMRGDEGFGGEPEGTVCV